MPTRPESDERPEPAAGAGEHVDEMPDTADERVCGSGRELDGHDLPG